MDENKRNLKGSPSRDAFKRRHKDLPKSFYAMDLDFVLITKTPIPDIICAIDYKAVNDGITFCEVIGYNALTMRGVSVFVAQGDAESGEFTISQYCGGHFRKPTYELTEVCRTKSWSEFEAWEKGLRKEFVSRWGEPRNG